MKQTKRFFAVLLAVVMLLGVVPVANLSDIGIKAKAASLDLSWPCESCWAVFTLYYYKTGSQHGTRWGYQHAIDISGSGNILAAESGTVVTSEYSSTNGFGNYIVIQHNNGDKTLYGHLASRAVSVNQTVSKGQYIGVMGSTGDSSGTHLHFEWSGGDPWKEVFWNKYADQIYYQQNVRSNNATYNDDQFVVDVIDTYYKKSGEYYYRNSTPVPPYSGSNIPGTPTYTPTPVVGDDKNAVVVGENITFWYSGLTECSKVEFCFEKNGEVYYRADSTSSTTFKTYFEATGTYYIFVRGLYNGEWYNSGKIKVTVLNPEICDNKNTVCVGESITFTYFGLTLCEEVQFEFSKNGTVYYSPDSTSSTTFSTYFENAGTYYVNAVGYLDGNWCRSGKVKVEVVNHSFGAWTRLNDTQHQRVCSRDSSHVEKANHTWNNGTVTKAATCSATGTKTYTCTVCNATKTETIAALGHSYGAWTKLNDTQHQRVCSRDSSHVEKANHTWNSGTVTKAATCSATGTKTYTCTVCNATKTEAIAALGHSYGAWTKLNDTQHQRVCSRDSSHVEKANHTWNSGTVTKAATCTETGVKTYICTVCNATKTETIAINSSNHVNTKNVAATASSCTVQGYSAGVYCNDCKKYLSGHAKQPLAAHTLTTINHRDATYDAEGYTGDQYCTA